MHPMFRPFPLLANGHTQTVIATKVGLTSEPPSVTKLVALPDGDQIALEVSTPEGWQPDDPTVILLHGLCGCHRSAYMIRIARKLWRRRVRAIRMNMRGCGSGHGWARQPYHSGRSADVLAVLEALHREMPQSPITLVGFSLGGNITLKLAGELRAAAATYLAQVIAVCPPADLAACSYLLGQPSNRLYEWYFMKLLKASVVALHGAFDDLPPVDLPDDLSLYTFDTLYTAPRCGFTSADDYYARSSAAPLVPQITIPCRILFAADDPVIDATVFDGVDLPAHVQVVRTTQGGHLGFLGAPWRPGGYRWMDTLLLEWIGAPAYLQVSPTPAYG